MCHLRGRHPAVSLVGKAGAKRVHSFAKTQQFATNSEKHEEITKAVGVFIIAKDLQPYSVVTDSGFRHLMIFLNRVTMSPPAHISVAK